MALKPCLDCGTLSDQARCPRCRGARNRERDARRGGTTARGYGAAHQRTREEWAPTVEAGLVDCWRCGQRIQPGEPWDLGHDDDDRSAYRGPEHAHQCNRSAAGRASHMEGGGVVA
jgi:hypothetical protein